MNIVHQTRSHRRPALVSAVTVLTVSSLVLSGCANSRAGDNSATSTSDQSSSAVGSSEAAGSSSTLGKCDLSAYSGAKIDWKQQSGKTVTLAVEEHPWWETVKPQISCFEELTGITVTPSVLGEDQFVAKLPTQLSGGSDTPDVFMVNQYGQAQGSGWLQPLNSYLDDPKLTDPAWYDVKDFFPGAQTFAQTKGQYLAMPITAEAQMLFVRDDLVKKIPTTFTELDSAASAANKDGVAGFGARAVASANETPWPFGGFAFSDGGQYLTADGKPELDSAANQKALKTYSNLISKYGAKGASGWGFLQNQQAMQQGKIAMWTDSSTLLGSLKDASKSKYAKDINAYPFPSGASGKSLPNAWYWTIGMNAKSKVKDAAWMFMQWATSLPISELGAAEGASPARQAAWDSPEASKAIGVDNAKRVKAAIASVDSSFMADAWKNNSWNQVADALARAVNSAVTGADGTAALKKAQDTAVSVLK